MIKKKICLLGSFGVGKTSLVRNFVYSIFDDAYQSTVGVKIDKKQVEIGGRPLEFLLWDIAGEDDRFTVPPSYLRGTAGYLLVIDGTRPATLERALDLQRRTEEEIGPVPFIAVLNKADLAESWRIDPPALAELEKRNWRTLKTSAKTGAGVEEAFAALGEKILTAS